MALERIILNIIPAGEMPVFHCSQYETGRPVIIDLVSSDDDAFLVGEGVSVELHCRKCDDTIVTMEPNEVDNNTVTFVTSEQLTACPGDNLCELVLYADTDPVQTLGTLNFILHVEPDPLAGGLTSESEISNLTQQIEDITQEVIGNDYYNKTEVDGLISGVESQIPTKTSDLTNDSGFITSSDLTPYAKTADLATVATTGDYDDLLNKPTIPDAQIQSDWEQADNTKVDYIKNKPDIDAMIAAALLAVMPVGTESGSIASFDTEIAAPLVNVSCDIVATGGNGTPDNPNPINGYTEANITRCGVNLLPLKFYKGLEYNSAIGNVFDTEEDTSGTISGNTVSFNIGSWGRKCMLSPKLPAGVNFRLSMTVTSSASALNYTEFYLDEDLKVTRKHNIQNSGTSRVVNAGFNLNEGECYIAVELGCNASATITFDSPQLELGSTATAYTPYNGNTVTIAFGQTVYGGVLDVTRGKLKPCIEYPSYNGETLSGRWLSSEATYIEGTTPPTGSQVVSLDDYGSDIDLTPEVILAVAGTNNVYTDTNGDTTVQYKDSIQHYIDTRI